MADFKKILQSEGLFYREPKLCPLLAGPCALYVARRIQNHESKSVGKLNHREELTAQLVGT